VHRQYLYLYVYLLFLLLDGGVVIVFLLLEVVVVVVIGRGGWWCVCTPALVMLLLLFIVFSVREKMCGGIFANDFVLVEGGRRFTNHGKRNLIQPWLRAFLAKESFFVLLFFPLSSSFVIVVHYQLFLPVVIWGY